MYFLVILFDVFNFKVFVTDTNPYRANTHSVRNADW